MARTATATAPVHATEETMTHVDELIQRGRGQGFLSLPELRDAFDKARVSASEARAIIRELTEAGVQLGNEPSDHAAVDVDLSSGDLEDLAGVELAAPEATDAELAALVGDHPAEPAAADSDPAGPPETDLDDQTSVMGDSVHTYLKSIGRRQLLTAEEEVDLAKRIEAGLYAEHKLETERRLSKQYRAELEAVAEDGRRAKAHMLEANLRLVVSVAKKYSDRGLSLLDVVQEGNLGLIRAVEKFDYTKGYKFSTYAMWWIRQAIQRGFADSARTIRLPVHVLEMLSKLSRVERDMHQRLGREPTPEELAVELDRTPDQIEELLRTSRQPISLDSTIGEDGETSIGDLIEDVDAPEAGELVDRQLMADQLRHALDALTPREATIMSMRFGLYDGNPHTLDEIGKALGLTRERIRQLEKQSLSKLRPGSGVPPRRPAPSCRGPRPLACGHTGVVPENPLRQNPLLQKVDAVTIPVPDLDTGLRFYRDGLGHRLRWRNDEIGAVGLALPGSDTEIVLSTQLGHEPNWLVASADQAAAAIAAAGGRIIAEPEDIPVGRVAVVADPFGNVLVLLDLSKGRYVTDDDGNVAGVSR